MAINNKHESYGVLDCDIPATLHQNSSVNIKLSNLIVLTLIGSEIKDRLAGRQTHSQMYRQTDGQTADEYTDGYRE